MQSGSSKSITFFCANVTSAFGASVSNAQGPQFVLVGVEWNHGKEDFEALPDAADYEEWQDALETTSPQKEVFT